MELLIAWMTKEGFTTLVGEPVSDERWSEIVNDVRGRLDNLADAILDDLIKDCRTKSGLFSEF